jgi:hypothetical protein
MKFRDQIPEDLFENPYLEKFITLLDELNNYKQSIINKSLRFYRSPLNTNTYFLKRRLEDDYGFPTIPIDFPKDVMDALLLNAEDINAMRGSIQGLRTWLWCLTFGNIVIDDSLFYPVTEFISLSDQQKGFVSKTDPLYPNTPQDPDLFLFDDLNQFGTSILNITIDTMYHNHPSIPTYINTHIKKYLTFVTSNAVINVTLNPGVYVTNTDPYQYFVKP